MSKQQINERAYMQKVAGLITESEYVAIVNEEDGLENGKYKDFNKWLEVLKQTHTSESNKSTGVSGQIQKLTKGEKVTPEQFIAAIKAWSKGNTYASFTYDEDKNKIVAAQSMPRIEYGEWSLENGEGVVNPPSDVTPSSLIYPKSDNETDKRSGYGDSFDRST